MHGEDAIDEKQKGFSLVYEHALCHTPYVHAEPGTFLLDLGGNMMNSVCCDDGRARERQAALVVAH